MKKKEQRGLLRISQLGMTVIRLFSPEWSHRIALEGLKVLNSTGIKLVVENQSSKPVEFLGLKFKNRLGLSGGLDKNGDFIEALSSLGFGFIELGTVTPRPQKGNKKPRLFRDSKNLSLLNRMGFNNKGVEYLVSKVKESKTSCQLAISISKNFDTPNSKAIHDYLFCLEKAYPVCNFITINISSPNTKDLRSLQNPKEMADLLYALKEKQLFLSQLYGYKPLLIKISPDEDEQRLVEISKIVLSNEIDGLIATNTTINHENLKGKGGMSGKPLFAQSTKVLKLMRKSLGKEFPIIASGGVTDTKTYKEKIAGGANLVQIYTGMIFKGPNLVQDILNLDLDI